MSGLSSPSCFSRDLGLHGPWPSDVSCSSIGILVQLLGQSKDSVSLSSDPHQTLKVLSVTVFFCYLTFGVSNLPISSVTPAPLSSVERYWEHFASTDFTASCHFLRIYCIDGSCDLRLAHHYHIRSIQARYAVGMREIWLWSAAPICPEHCLLQSPSCGR
jgi:hypothetical protein